jgi:hypothetical protein
MARIDDEGGWRVMDCGYCIFNDSCEECRELAIQKQKGKDENKNSIVVLWEAQKRPL